MCGATLFSNLDLLSQKVKESHHSTGTCCGVLSFFTVGVGVSESKVGLSIFAWKKVWLLN